MLHSICFVFLEDLLHIWWLWSTQWDILLLVFLLNAIYILGSIYKGSTCQLTSTSAIHFHWSDWDVFNRVCTLDEGGTYLWGSSGKHRSVTMRSRTDFPAPAFNVLTRLDDVSVSLNIRDRISNMRFTSLQYTTRSKWNTGVLTGFSNISIKIPFGVPLRW